jgi:glycine dehydrogenase subunit 2
LDEYAKVLKTIIKEIHDEPELVKNAPHTTPGRLDEVKAARQLNLRWIPSES